MKRIIAILLMVMALVFGVTATAQAGHVGPFVKNEVCYGPPVTVHYDDHAGLPGTVNLGCNQFSPRGAMFVITQTPIGSGTNYRTRIRSIVTGVVYTSACDQGLQIGNGDGTGNSAVVIATFAC